MHGGLSDSGMAFLIIVFADGIIIVSCSLDGCCTVSKTSSIVASSIQIQYLVYQSMAHFVFPLVELPVNS